MTTLPRSQRLVKDAIVTRDIFKRATTIISIQYNPNRMPRTLQAQAAGEGGNRAEAMRLKGAPVETFKLDVEIDAVDQLEKAEGTATSMGIYPQLSGLEMLIYP